MNPVPEHLAPNRVDQTQPRPTLRAWPLDGYWAGHQRPAGVAARRPFRLVLRFRGTVIAGSGDGPRGPFDVFGIYGPHSGRCALLLTDRTGGEAELEGVRRGDGIAGTWLDRTGEMGEFTIWPAEREPVDHRGGGGTARGWHG